MIPVSKWDQPENHAVVIFKYGWEECIYFLFLCPWHCKHSSLQCDLLWWSGLRSPGSNILQLRRGALRFHKNANTKLCTRFLGAAWVLAEPSCHFADLLSRGKRNAWCTNDICNGSRGRSLNMPSHLWLNSIQETWHSLFLPPSLALSLSYLQCHTVPDSHKASQIHLWCCRGLGKSWLQTNDTLVWKKQHTPDIKCNCSLSKKKKKNKSLRCAKMGECM